MLVMKQKLTIIGPSLSAMSTLSQRLSVTLNDDIQHNDTQHIDTQHYKKKTRHLYVTQYNPIQQHNKKDIKHNDTEHYDTQHKNKKTRCLA